MPVDDGPHALGATVLEREGRLGRRRPDEYELAPGVVLDDAPDAPEAGSKDYRRLKSAF